MPVSYTAVIMGMTKIKTCECTQKHNMSYMHFFCLMNPGMGMDTKFVITKRDLHFNRNNQSQSRPPQITTTKKKGSQTTVKPQKMPLASSMDAEIRVIEVLPCTPIVIKHVLNSQPGCRLYKYFLSQKNIKATKPFETFISSVWMKKDYMWHRHVWKEH